MEGSKVSFTWIDYADNIKQKLMTLNAEEFIRRFILLYYLRASLRFGITDCFVTVAKRIIWYYAGSF